VSFDKALKLAEQSRLADAGLTLNQEKPPAPEFRVLKQRGELGELLVALEKPRPAPRRSCIGNGGQL
jgi:hypothetical protein